MSLNRYALVLAIIAVIAMGLPRAGWADWAYTKWGMSLDEVIAASPEDIAPLDEKFQEQSRENVSDRRSAAMLAGSYVEDGYTYTALFYFDLRSRKLVSVNLDLRTTTLADQLLRELTETYGAPIGSTDFLPDFFSRIWEENGNRIVYLRRFESTNLNFFAK